MTLLSLHHLQNRSNSANLVADIGVIVLEKLEKNAERIEKVMDKVPGGRWLKRITAALPGVDEITFALSIAADISGIVAGASTIGVGMKSHSVADELVGIGQIFTGGMDIGGLSAKKLPGILGKSKDVSSEIRDSDSFDESSITSVRKSNAYEPPSMKTNVVQNEGSSYNMFPQRQSEMEDSKTTKLLEKPSPSSTPLYMKPMIGIQKSWKAFQGFSLPDKILAIKATVDIGLGVDMVGTSLYDKLGPKTTTWEGVGISSAVGAIGVWESLTTASM